MRVDMTSNRRYVPKSHAKLEVLYIIYNGDDDVCYDDDHDSDQSGASDDDYDYHNDHAGELTDSATLNEWIRAL